MFIYYIMDLLKDYDEDTIKKMINVYDSYLKQKEYRKNYYGNKYKNDEEYRNKKREVNKLCNRKRRDLKKSSLSV